MEVDGALASFDLTALQRKFSREYTNLYLKIAHSARLQSNYPVATKYLKLTESALNEVTLKSPQIDLIIFVNRDNIIFFCSISHKTLSFKWSGFTTWLS